MEPRSSSTRARGRNLLAFIVSTTEQLNPRRAVRRLSRECTEYTFATVELPPSSATFLLSFARDVRTAKLGAGYLMGIEITRFRELGRE